MCWIGKMDRGGRKLVGSQKCLRRELEKTPEIMILPLSNSGLEHISMKIWVLCSSVVLVGS